MDQDSGPNGDKGFSFLCAYQNQPWDPPSLFYNGYWGSFSGDRWLRCGINDSPLYSAEVENGKIYTSTSPLCQPRHVRGAFAFVYKPTEPKKATKTLVFYHHIHNTAAS
jgi:hypothetical protein